MTFPVIDGNRRMVSSLRRNLLRAALILLRRPEPEDVASITRVAPLGAAITAINAGVLFANTPNTPFGLWFLSVLVVSLVLYRRSRAARRIQVTRVSQRAVRRMNFLALLMALPWIALPGLMATIPDPWDRSIAFLVLVGMSSGGLLMLHRVMSATVIYCGSILLAALSFAFLIDGLAAWPIAVYAVLYGSIQFASARNVGDMSRERDRSLAELTRANARIRQLALEDQLTGLPNRTALTERLEALVGRGRPVALYMLDLDNFKNVNDSYGHPTGDALLEVIAARLRGFAGEGTMVARLGGDEFAVLVEGPAGAEAVAAHGEDILGAARLPAQVGDQLVYPGGSVGGALFPAHATDTRGLMGAADIGLHVAKGRGRGQFVAFEQEFMEAITRKKAVSEGLRVALASQKVEVHYQPKVSMRDGALQGAEALVRWTDPDLGAVSTEAFVEIAAEHGLMPELSDYIADRVARDIVAWREAGCAPGKIALNLHPVDLKSSERLTARLDAMQELGVGPKDVLLEITEGCVVGRGTDRAALLIDTLCERGYELSLDDFGTGHAALSHLKRLPVSEVKIDRSFVAGICDAPHDDAIIAAIATLTRGMGLRLIVEGVETEEQRRKLMKHGITIGQGHLWSPALPPGDFAAYVGRRKVASSKA